MNQELAGEIDINRDIKAENIKKALIVIVILGIFGCIYYYYNGMHNIQNNTIHQSELASISQNQTLSTLKTTNNKKIILQSKKLTIVLSKKPPIKAITPLSKEGAGGKNHTSPLIKPSLYIPPTNKNSILKLALASSGKADPFAGMGKEPDSPQNMPSLSNIPNIGKLPSLKNLTIPPSIGSLPTIGNLPNTGMPGFMPPLSEQFSVKGFIGDEVIVEIDGIVQSLKVNTSFHGLRVLKIDASNLSAVFKMDGKIITKNIKSQDQTANFS